MKYQGKITNMSLNLSPDDSVSFFSHMYLSMKSMSSTHNISFHGEVKKPSVFFSLKNAHQNNFNEVDIMLLWRN